MLSKSGACLERLLNKLHEICIFLSLEVDLLHQETFYLDEDQIEITHEYRYFGIDFYSHGYFEPASKRQRMAKYDSLDGHFKGKKKTKVGVVCWELTSHLPTKALVLLTFTYDIGTWGGDLKTLIGRLWRRA
jgi:hypothetical protein